MVTVYLASSKQTAKIYAGKVHPEDHLTKRFESIMPVAKETIVAMSTVQRRVESKKSTRCFASIGKDY